MLGLEGGGGGIKEGGGRTWSLIRLRREPVPTLMIFDENSTPMVWEERTRPVVCQWGEGRRGRGRGRERGRQGAEK